MNKNNNFLSEDFTSAPEFTAGYDHFMDGLLDVVHSGPVTDSMGDRIKTYALDFVKEYPLTPFDQYSDSTYVRNYIGRDPETHWEAIVMSWKKGNQTAIHSHPQFASYTFADGIFEVEVFEPQGDGIRLVDDLIVDHALGLYAIGEAGKFDNHIHRITCLSETAHSLHIYSDDALKGMKLDESRVL